MMASELWLNQNNLAAKCSVRLIYLGFFSFIYKLKIHNEAPLPFKEQVAKLVFKSTLPCLQSSLRFVVRFYA